MIWSKLTNGTPFFGIKIEHFVTKTVFAKAIASYCWLYKKEFDPNTKKRRAIEILKEQLFHQGQEGINTDHWDGASEDFIRPFNDAYENAIAWINKNYPYLNNN